MCITFFLLNSKPNQSGIKFMIAFNRDEYADRETSPFSQFEDDENVYAGRDIISGGSWLGINVKTGIMVILTNYRKVRPKLGKSRGLLVKHFLSSQYVDNIQNTSSQEISNRIYQDMVKILENPHEYSPHSISVYNIRDDKIYYMCNQLGMKEPISLQNNIVQGYSNTDISTNWQKVTRGKNMFQAQMQSILEQKKPNPEDIFLRMQKIMKNEQGTSWFWKYFQTSIFIPRYYNLYWRGYRMTKSTFYAVFTQKQQGQIQAHIRQVTYKANNLQQKVQLNLTI